MRAPPRLLALALLALLAACSSSTTLLQTARPLEPGHVQVTGAMSLPISTSVISELIDDAKQINTRLQADESKPLTEDESRELLETSLALMLFSPIPQSELMGRVGITKDLDAGLRWSSALWKADAKYRFSDPKARTQYAVMGGLAYHTGYAASALSKLYDVLEYVELGDYSRTDADLALIISRDWGEWFRLYGAARYMASWISLDADLTKVESIAELPPSDLNNTMHFYGATGGLMIGYKYVFVNLELSVLKLSYEPKVFGEARDLSGYLVTPTWGLSGFF